MSGDIRSKPGIRQKRAKHGDVQSIVRIDNPDDAEIARPLGEGDENTLIKVDNPDDADIYDPDQQQYAKPPTGSNLNQRQPKK
jgi:hypothetical protein